MSGHTKYTSYSYELFQNQYLNNLDTIPKQMIGTVYNNNNEK